MPGDFTIQVYTNPVRANTLLTNAWGAYAEGLTFSTNAFGGYAACEFTLRLDYPQLLNYLYGTTDQPSYVTNRIRILDPFGVVVYEGMIYSLALTAGSETFAVSADNLYNCAGVEYDVVYATRTETRVAFYNDGNSRAAFGKKATRQRLDGVYALAATVPGQVAARFVTQHAALGKPSSRTKGGDSTDLQMQVSCVGLATTLEWRYAYNNLTASVDTSQIVKDMLSAGAIPERTAGAHKGINGWIEQLDDNKKLAFGQEFISPTNFTNIATSGASVPRNVRSGVPRIEIIQQAASYGSSNYRRMLFQVWHDDANAGKGIPYFVEQSEKRPEQNGYSGYFDYAHEPTVLDAGQTRIPLWRTRAGKWITTLGVVPNTNYPSVYTDPRCFWIEETTYDVDAATLTLSSASEFNLTQYIGRLIGGKRVIKDAS